jgi:hypothetical protein
LTTIALTATALTTIALITTAMTVTAIALTVTPLTWRTHICVPRSHSCTTNPEILLRARRFVMLLPER